jgi:hypothetical protein
MDAFWECAAGAPVPLLGTGALHGPSGLAPPVLGGAVQYAVTLPPVGAEGSGGPWGGVGSSSDPPSPPPPSHDALGGEGPPPTPPPAQGQVQEVLHAEQVAQGGPHPGGVGPGSRYAPPVTTSMFRRTVAGLVATQWAESVRVGVGAAARGRGSAGALSSSRGGTVAGVALAAEGSDGQGHDAGLALFSDWSLKLLEFVGVRMVNGWR